MSKGLGDALEELLKPIARALGVEDCSGCKRRRDALNRAGDAMKRRKAIPCTTCGEKRKKRG